MSHPGLPARPSADRGSRPAARLAAGLAAGLAGCGAVVVLASCGSSEGPVAEDPGTTAPVVSSPATTPTTASADPTSATSAPGQADVLITLDEPVDGATVSGSLTASGTANSPEANVPWRVLNAAGDSVLEGAFTAEGWMDRLYPYSGSVDVSSLARGTYTFVVQVDDPSDGEGEAPQQVRRSITVS